MQPATSTADVKRETAPASTPMLFVNNIEVVHNHVILVLKGVSRAVPKGEIVALLGANGAGKTTTLKAISDLLESERGEVTKGSIVFHGAEVQAMTPNDLVRRGCIQVMEGRHEHLGEAYLVKGDLNNAERQLAKLESICSRW